MTRVEAAAMVSGGVLMVVALTLIDIRLGMAVAGLFLIISALDPPRRRP